MDDLLSRISIVLERQDFRMCVPPESDDTDIVLEECRDTIESLRQQLEECKLKNKLHAEKADIYGKEASILEDTVEFATEYALNTAKYLRQHFYSEVTQWEPLNDLIGLQTQISNMVTGIGEQLAAALATCEAKDAALSAIIGATKSHVDGRDLLAELHPRHYMDIKVRRNGKDIWFEADWLSNLQRAITSHKAALAIKPDASTLKAHDEALIERCAVLQEQRSTQRHGVDKYGDAAAIRELKNGM